MDEVLGLLEKIDEDGVATTEEHNELMDTLKKNFQLCGGDMHKILLVLAGLTLLSGSFPNTVSARIDCTSAFSPPTEAELEKFNIHPWYADEDGINEALVSVLTRTDFEESLLIVKNTAPNEGPGEKDKPKRSSTGSVETDIILGMADFIVDRAKAETVNWYMDEMQNKLCDGKYGEYFYNTCVMRSQSKETMPYLPGLVQAFRKDLEIMPANLLCKDFKTDRGYYFTTLIKSIASGYPPENMLAGLAANEGIDQGCSADAVSSQNSTCDLYLTGLLAQAYVKYAAVKRPDISAALNMLNDGLQKKNLVPAGMPDLREKQYFLELAALVRDIQLQMKKIKLARKEGNEEAMISSSASQIGKDLIEIVDNPLAKSVTRAPDSRNMVKPLINAINSITAGQYADAMLDINIIIGQYYDNKLQDISREYKDKMDSLRGDIIAAVAKKENTTFNSKEFADDDAMKSVCDSIYAQYFGEDGKHCGSIADFNELLQKGNLPERVLDVKKNYSKKVEGLLIVQYYLETRKSSPEVEAQKKYVQSVLNRLILEEAVPGVPKSSYCHANMLEVFAILYNPDELKKNAQKISATRYLAPDERLAEIKKALNLPEQGIWRSLFNPGHCDEVYKKISQFVSDAYSQKDIDMISSSNSFQKYLPTVASLATAKTQEEVKNVLNDTAASVGSWRLKQQKSTGSFGAMFGLDAGYEYLGNSAHDGWSAGLFVPVGVDFTTTKHCPAAACGLFLSALDLGTVASMRLSDKSAFTGKEGNLHLSEVASPGAYVHVSVKNTPLVFGMGWSYVPLLRTETVNSEKVERSGSRVLLFLAVDLPMYFF